MLAELYEQHHGSLEVSIARDAGYWEYLWAKQPEDEFYRLDAGGGGATAYVRLRTGGERLSIRDVGLAHGNVTLWSGLLAHVVVLAAERSIARIGGWLPQGLETSRFGRLRRREREITMLRPLDASLDVGDDLWIAAQHFVEIDHV